MANYTGPDPNRLLPGEPWTSDLALAAFEDPVAIAEGAAGAPGISGNSIENDFNTDTEKRLSVVSVTAADTVVITQGLRKKTIPYVGTSEKDVATYTNLAYTGSIRFFAIYSDDEVNDRARLYKNGTLVASFGSGGSPASVDVSVTIGDTFKWTLRQSATAGSLSPSEFASDGYVSQQTFALASKLDLT